MLPATQPPQPAAATQPPEMAAATPPPEPAAATQPPEPAAATPPPVPPPTKAKTAPPPAGIKAEWPVLSKDESTKMREAFTAANTNNDNVISRDELRAVWRSTFPDIQEDRLIKMVDDVIAVADIDGDGTINFDEFLNLCSIDSDLRFDISFVRNQGKRAADQLGLALYIPFVVLFVYYLVSGKALGTGFSMKEGILDSIDGEEFAKSETVDAKFFKDLNSEEFLYKWLLGPVVDSFWPSSGNARGKVFLQSQTIGAIKIRQVRIKPGPCSAAHEKMLDWKHEALDYKFFEERKKEFDPICHLDYNDGEIATTSYTNLNVSTLASPDNAWAYRSCATLNGSWRTTGRHARYGCDGNALIIPINDTRREATAKINELVKGVVNQDGVTVRWVDDNTRAVVLEFITYNKNIKFFAFSSFLVEFTAGGAVFSSRHVNLFHLHQWNNHHGIHWLFYFVYFFSVIGYVVRLGFRLHGKNMRRLEDKRRSGAKFYTWSVVVLFFKDPWFIFDVVNLNIFLVAFGFQFTWMAWGLSGASLLQVSYYPSSLEALSVIFNVMSLLNAMNALLVFVRAFKFLRLNARLNVLTMTVERALPSLIGIIIVFFVVFVGFALMSLVAFGHVSEDFKDWDSTVSALSRMLVGDFDYISLRNERRDFTGVFFVLYIIICVFLLLNMIIAVLSNAFKTVEDEKYDFGPITTVMSFVKSELKATSFLGGILQYPIFLEGVYWWTVAALWWRYRSKEISREEYDVAMEDAGSRCPRIYWQTLEGHLLSRSIVMDFQAKLKLTPIALNDHFHRTFGSDIVALKEMLVTPTVAKTGISERDLLLDLVEYHHHWAHDVEMYCNMAGENTTVKRRSSSLSPPHADVVNVDELTRRVDALSKTVEAMPELIAKKVLEGLEVKRNEPYTGK